ncbi:hypothetical protein RCL_jg25147.t1 [Rhizophagus clarus]|uniref:Uncharacterized protein n=1 Tax=Rhizophagus clarus TaxID=94130 RepID=A0A8H3LRH8_9GLOM|nr:hypothetical protein RCL_jg25147.t1 [Rhizophagus clarus]
MKTNLVGGCGVICVDVPDDEKDFSKAFGEALNFLFEEQIVKNDKFEDPKWKRTMKTFNAYFGCKNQDYLQDDAQIAKGILLCSLVVKVQSQEEWDHCMITSKKTCVRNLQP